MEYEVNSFTACTAASRHILSTVKDYDSQRHQNLYWEPPGSVLSPTTELFEKLGGKLTILSPPGEGTTASVTIGLGRIVAGEEDVDQARR